MRKVPSYLKGLAETRARAAGDIEHLSKLKAQIDERIAEAQQTLESCDVLIRKFDKRLDPTKIEPIRAQKGRYGTRGGLRNGIVRILEAAYPRALPTDELGLALQFEFDIEFLLPTEHRDWLHNSVGKQLQRLVAEGILERLHELTTIGVTGRWRWKPTTGSSLDGLRAQAEEAGLSVQQAEGNDQELDA